MNLITYFHWLDIESIIYGNFIAQMVFSHSETDLAQILNMMHIYYIIYYTQYESLRSTTPAIFYFSECLLTWLRAPCISEEAPRCHFCIISLQ